MKKFLIAILLLPSLLRGQTLEQCYQAAQENYPLIAQYDLIAKTTNLTIGNISKGWLPQLAVNAQATYQSDVTSFPESLQAIYRQAGIDIEGLKKDQYRVSVDLRQTLYDGGTMSGRADVARKQGEMELAQHEVAMYQIKQRVNDMYFGLLLLDSQINLNNDLQQVLDANEKKLSSLAQHGAAAESDYFLVKAERISVAQQATELQSSRRALAAMLSLLCGININNVTMPERIAAPNATSTVLRPELRVFDAKLGLLNARQRLLDAELRPKLSLFAQGFYGYPGYNLFDDMMSNKWSLGGMVGIKMSWNIGALYTRKNDKTRIALERNITQNNSDVFLFDNNIKQIEQMENINRYEQLMETDNEIIMLRSKVRIAAESKLDHGIIDAHALIKEIHAEHAALQQRAIHEINMTKEIYDLKITTNN